MLKFKCLVLDHDDTVVRSEVTVNYPCFLLALEKFRPGETMGYEEFVDWCYRYDFAEFLRIRYGFTEEELLEEYHMWQDYSKTHIPPAYDGMKEIILEQKRRGGLVCVASLSSQGNILRDYHTHFGIEPDIIFSCDDPQEHRKPNVYPLTQMMEKFNLSPADMLMVDDLKIGCDMAKKAGVPMAFAGWSRADFPEIRAQMSRICDFSFESTKDLAKFLFD
jgi:phosphoglycolate phosphatase/pyrophosphatase PpaX